MEAEKTRSFLGQKVREIAQENDVDVVKIFLFGSRARGDFAPKSDWDVLVVVRNPVSVNGKMSLSRKIREKLARTRVDCDVIVKSEAEVERYQDVPGSVVKEALKESVPL